MEFGLIIIAGLVLLCAYEYRHRLIMQSQIDQTKNALQCAEEKANDLQTQLEELHHIHEEAFNQTISGVLTWHAFEEGFQQAILEGTRHQLQFGVLLVRISDYAMLSKFLNPEQLKRFIQAVSKTLKNAIREEDRMGQFSESIFAVMLRYVQRKEAVAIVAKRFLDASQESILIDGLSIQVKLKIGIAVFPEDGLDISSLMSAAESALQSIENASQPIYQFCKADANVKQALEIKAYEYIMQDTFFEKCKIQWKKYQNSTGKQMRIFSLSAIDPVKMSQGHLLSFLEQYGKIETCLEFLLKNIPNEARSNPNIQLGFPLLASQAENIHFIYRLPKMLQDYGIAASQCIWLLQGLSKASDMQEVGKGLNRLNYLGSQIGLDWFGKNGLDLSIFKESKIHFLRLSKTFLSESFESPESKKLLMHLIHFANDMDVALIAPSQMKADTLNQLQGLSANFLFQY